MTVPDRAAAAEALRRLGYYRLSGYWYPYRRIETLSDGTFIRHSELSTPVSFDQVLEVAEFDRQLRMRMFDALEIVEVAMRTAIAEQLGPRDAFAHRIAECLDPSFAAKIARRKKKRKKRADHASWVRELDRLEKRSEEAFAKHHRERYGGPFPIWMAVQVMSFGAVSTLFSGLKSADRSKIATDFDLLSSVPDGDGAALGSWLNHLRHVRNLCAHHSRLWNRNFDVVLGEVSGVPELAQVRDKIARRLYGTLLALRYLSARIDPTNSTVAETAEFAAREAGRLGLDLESMGFLPGWASNQLWDPGYMPDLFIRGQISALRALDSLQISQLASLLTTFEYQVAKGKVRYLRKKHALIGARVLDDGVRLFPEFQVDRGSGDFIPQVLSANRKLYMANPTVSEEEHHWLALRWWSTSLERLGDRSPIDALRAGELDQVQIDLLLPGPEE